MPLNKQEMSKSVENLCVVDVYDLASEIGGECEKLIDLYGTEAVKNLISKCIMALEMLEALANKNERDVSYVKDLRDQVKKLEDEKLERAETKKKFEEVSDTASALSKPIKIIALMPNKFIEFRWKSQQLFPEAPAVIFGNVSLNVAK